MADAVTKLSPADEADFQDWYKVRAKEEGIDPNPDNPQHFYDYRAAYLAGAEPDSTGHWPSDYKLTGHPRMFENADGSFTPTPGKGAMNTKTGEYANIADMIRAKMGKPSTGDVTPLPESMGDPSEDQSRAMARQIMQKLGADPNEAFRVAPGQPIDNTAYSSMPRGSVDHITAQHEGAQVAQDDTTRGLPVRPDTAKGVGNYLSQYEDAVTGGLAAAVKFVNDAADAAGEKAGSIAASGVLNLNLGMGQLDAFAKVDNWLKLGLFNFASTIQKPFASQAQRENLDAKRAYMTLKYLPNEVIQTDNGTKRFDNSTAMASWLAGQNIWGAVNDLAALPADAVGKVLGSMRMSDAEAYAHDIARRDRAVGDQQARITSKGAPAMIAGMAPLLGYQQVIEGQFKPETLDSVYKWYYDHGKLGDAVMAAEAGLGAYADYKYSPTVLIGEIPAGLFKYAPKATKALNPEADARITSSIARRTWQFPDAFEAHKSAQNLTQIAQDAVDVAKAKGSVSPELYRNLISAKKNEAREFLWLDQFSDPGEYEPMMPRAQRRSPDHIPEVKDTQYYSFLPPAEGSVANARPGLKITTQRELSQASRDAMRKQALTEGAHMPVDWSDPKQLTLGEKEQRILMGPSDAEYTGDALNMLVRGALIDDVVTASHLTPEYHILPDVQTSLVDMRKVEQANKQAAIEAMTSPKLLAEEERHTRIALGRAKAVNAKDLVEQHRANLRLIKQTRKNLPDMLGEEFDTTALPDKVPGIMEDPQRFNDHLLTAGDRAIRSLYPGGLMLTGWHTRLGQMLGMAREPMRYYQTYAPQRWEEIRGGLLNMDTFHKGATELLTKLMLDAGVMVKREGAFNPAKFFSPNRVDKVKSEQLAKMLDSVVGTPEHEAAIAGATPEMTRAHGTIRAMLDQFADRQGISATERYLSGYFRHMWDPTLFDHGARSIEFVGIPHRSEMMVSHLLHRNGAPGYKLDAPLVLDLYMRAAYRKLIMDPVYKNIERTGQELATQFNNPSHISYANDLINQMKGTPSFLSAKVDDMIGGAINANGGISLPFTDKKLQYNPGWLDRQILGTFSLLHSGLTIGPHYPILQIASGLSTTAGRFGPFATMRGVFSYATKEGQQLGKAAGTYRPFVDYMESKPMQKFMEAVQGSVGGRTMPLSNSWAEAASRGISYNVAMKHYMNKMGFGSVQELMRSPFGKRVMFESMRAAEETNHLYGPLGRSPVITRMYGSATSTAATQLLSFIPKQSEELLAQAGKNPGHIMRYFAFSGALMRMAAATGIDMTRDVGYGYLPQHLTDVTSPAVDAAIENVMMQDAIDRGDGAEVERRAANLARMLPNLIPGYLLVSQGAKAVQRLKNQTVQDRSGNPVYRMNMMPQGDTGIGGEFVPTATMQRNIQETLARRGLQLTRQRTARNQYLGAKAVEHYIEAVDNNDQDAAQKFADEMRAHDIRMANPVGSVESAWEMRAYSYSVRNLMDHPQLQDQFQELYRQYHIPVEP